MDLDDPPKIDADDPDERREQLIEAAKTRREQLTEEQTDILDAISEEHGGEVIETRVSLTPEHTAEITCKFNGSLMDRLGAIEDRLNKWEEFDPESDPRSEAPPLSDLSRTADEMAALLADLTVSEDYNKDLFYSVYEAESFDVLGELFMNAVDAIQTEEERQQGAVDGFREE